MSLDKKFRDIALRIGATATIFAGPMAPRAFAQDVRPTTTESSAGIADYSRPEDATTPSMRVTHFGQGRFAPNAAESVVHIQDALDTFVQHEGVNLTAAQRLEIARVVAQAPNFSQFPIRGANPNFIAPEEVADGQVGRRNGQVVYEGDGAQNIRIDMPEVANALSETGRVSVPADRFVIPLTIPGRGDVYLVMTRAEDCDNWIFKILNHPAQVPVAVESPCMDFIIDDLPAGTEVTRFEVVVTKDGGQMSEQDRQNVRTCLRESEDLGNVISRNCDNCMTPQQREEFDRNLQATLRAHLPSGVGLRYDDGFSISKSRVDQNNELHLRIPRQDNPANGDNSLLNEVLCFSVKGANGQVEYRSHAFVVEDNNTRGKQIERNRAQDLPIEWFDASGRRVDLQRNGAFRLRR